MKKLVFGGIILSVLSIGIISCKKNVTPKNVKPKEVCVAEKPLVNRNVLSANVVINDSIEIRTMREVVDGITINNTVEIVNVNTNQIEDYYTFTYVGASSDDISETNLKAGLTSGQFQLFHKTELIGETTILNGVITKKVFNYLDVSGNRAPPSTWRRIRYCVASTIENMNIIDYSLCLVAAPACYAQIWASCTYDNW